MLRSAFKVLSEEETSPDALSKRGAAVGFIEGLKDVFTAAACNLDLAPMFKDKFIHYETELQERLEAMRKTNASILKDLTAGAANAPMLKGARHA